MALVDSLLKLMSAQNADVLVIPSTEPPWLERDGEPRPLSMPSLGADMVEAMIEELVEPAQRERLDGGAAVETHYEDDQGLAYGVRIEPRAEGPRLTLRRADADEAAEASAPPSPQPERPAVHEAKTPQRQRREEERRGKPQHLHDRVGERRAGDPHQVLDRGGGGVGEARIAHRPRGEGQTQKGRQREEQPSRNGRDGPPRKQHGRVIEEMFQGP